MTDTAHFTASLTDLTAHIKAVTSTLGKRIPVPVLNTVQFTADADGLQVATFDYETSHRRAVDSAEVETPGGFLVGASAVKRALTGLAKGVPPAAKRDLIVSVEATSRGWATFTVGDRSVTLERSSDEDYPYLPTFPDGAPVLVRGEVLQRVAGAAVATAGQGDRPADGTVVLQSNEDRIQVVQTGGVAATLATIAANAPAPLPTVSLEASELAAAVAALPDGPVELVANADEELGPQQLGLRAGQVTVTLRLSIPANPEPYLDLLRAAPDRQLVSDQSGVVVLALRRLVRDAICDLRGSSRKTVQVRLTGDGERITVSYATRDGSSNAVAGSVETGTKSLEFDVVANAVMLDRVFALPNASTISFYGSEKGVITVTDGLVTQMVIARTATGARPKAVERTRIAAGDASSWKIVAAALKRIGARDAAVIVAVGDAGAAVQVLRVDGEGSRLRVRLDAEPSAHRAWELDGQRVAAALAGVRGPVTVLAGDTDLAFRCGERQVAVPAEPLETGEVTMPEATAQLVVDAQEWQQAAHRVGGFTVDKDDDPEVLRDARFSRHDGAWVAEATDRYVLTRQPVAITGTANAPEFRIPGADLLLSEVVAASGGGAPVTLAIDGTGRVAIAAADAMLDTTPCGKPFPAVERVFAQKENCTSVLVDPGRLGRALTSVKMSYPDTGRGMDRYVAITVSDGQMQVTSTDGRCVAETIPVDIDGPDVKWGMSVDFLMRALSGRDTGDVQLHVQHDRPDGPRRGIHVTGGGSETHDLVMPTRLSSLQGDVDAA